MSGDFLESALIWLWTGSVKKLQQAKVISLDMKFFTCATTALLSLR